jgi:DTW domain-containing protein YfiP/GNAT superfamily N-acetyltransferase
MRPPTQCLCEHLPSKKIELETEVLVLQHPVEFRRKTISTLPLLKLVLEQCRVLVGRSFDSDLESIINEACAEGRIPLLLFPGPNATVLEDCDAMDRLQSNAITRLSSDNIIDAEHRTTKYMLIIVDGTWTQAKRMVRNSPVLMQKCNPIQFTGTDDVSIYDSIRKQPDTHCLSTLESCVRTLQLLEPNNTNTKEASRHLLDSLRAMILTQMKYEQIHLEKHPNLVRNVSKLKAKKERQKHILSTTNMLSTTDNTGYNEMLPDGYRLRPLLLSDAEFVDSRWPYRSKKSLVMIKKQIGADNLNATRTGYSTCLGIEHKGKLIACIMRHRNGSLGILHVDEEHRRQRLGEVLLASATKALEQTKDPVFAFIVDGNAASETLFTKLGWSKTYSGKKGTGKRRAKRLWEYRGGA